MFQKGPLNGVRVVELGHIMAGPVCGLMLADMGADVVKIEKPNGGDDTRRMTPPTIGDQSAAFMMVNRNKRGVAIDLKHPDGVAAARRLIVQADIVVENYRKGGLDKLGLGYASFADDNPGLIWTEISGYGRTGPAAEKGGFDLIAQGLSGLMSITGESGDRPPAKCGPPVTDITAGILGAMGALAAYIERLKTGCGQRVDTSLMEAGIVHTYWQSAIAFATGASPGPMGSAHPLNAPYQAFQTADGWITVGAANQANWLRLLDALDARPLAADERFTSNADRMAHLDALVDALAPYFRAQTSADLLAKCDAAGLPAGPVLSVGAMHDHPQTLARGMTPTVPHSTLGDVRTLGLPIAFSQSPGGPQRGAPLLGEHTREALSAVGYDAAEIDALIERGAIAEA